MNTATVGTNVATLLIYGASLVVVVWCIVDVTRRPPDELTGGKKTAWVVASLLGWLLLGSSVQPSLRSISSVHGER